MPPSKPTTPPTGELRATTRLKSAASNEVTSEESLPKANILLVDDLSENLSALEVTLTPLDQNLVFASSGEQALRLMLEQEFAVVLLDVHMPGMDGLELAELIRQRDKSVNTAIIFITADNTNSRSVVQAYSLGAVDYIFKPIVPEVLVAKVGVFVELFHHKRRLAKESEQLKQSRLKLEAANKRLEFEGDALARSNADLAQFAYVASHDLQEPLRAISGFLDLIKTRYVDQLDEQGVGYIEKSIAGSNRMSQLIKDLLRFSSITRTETEFESVNLSEVVDKACQEMDQLIKETQTKVETDSLPSIVGAQPLLLQLFRNLIGNAIRYRSNQDPAIGITHAFESGQVVVRFQDNGIGIEDEYREQVFDLFKRLHRREEHTGTGIGLAICRRVVERHGGTISIESGTGNGTCFAIRLPVSDSLQK